MRNYEETVESPCPLRPEVPGHFLIAGRINRSTACPADEKHDVIMPNGNFDCDAVSGRNLITVEADENYQVSLRLDYGDAVNQYLTDFVLSRSCAFWHHNPAARPYFEFRWKTNSKNAVLQPDTVSV